MEEHEFTQHAPDQDPPQGFEDIGGSGEAKSYILITIAVENPFGEVATWNMSAVKAAILRLLSFYGGRIVEFKGSIAEVADESQEDAPTVG